MNVIPLLQTKTADTEIFASDTRPFSDFLGGAWDEAKYHHSTKLYQKLSQVCCHLYSYECRARLYNASDNKQVIFFRYSRYHSDNNFIIWTFNFIA